MPLAGSVGLALMAMDDIRAAGRRLVSMDTVGSWVDQFRHLRWRRCRCPSTLPAPSAPPDGLWRAWRRGGEAEAHRAWGARSSDLHEVRLVDGWSEEEDPWLEAIYAQRWGVAFIGAEALHLVRGQGSGAGVRVSSFLS